MKRLPFKKTFGCFLSIEKQFGERTWFKKQLRCEHSSESNLLPPPPHQTWSCARSASLLWNATSGSSSHLGSFYLNWNSRNYTKSSELIDKVVHMDVKMEKFCKCVIELDTDDQKPHGAPYSQHGPHPTTQSLKFRRRNGTPVQSSWCPIMQKWVFGASISSNEPEINVFGSPGARATDWAFTDALPSLEAELCQFKISGSSPFTKRTKSWDMFPFQRKKIKAVCYRSKWLFVIFLVKRSQEMSFGRLFVMGPWPEDPSTRSQQGWKNWKIYAKELELGLW